MGDPADPDTVQPRDEHAVPSTPVEPTPRKAETARERHKRLLAEGRLADDPGFQNALLLAAQYRDKLGGQVEVPPYVPGPEVETAVAARQTADATQTLARVTSNQVSILTRIADASDTRATIDDERFKSEHRLNKIILGVVAAAALLALITLLSNLYGWRL
jgi:hypothetical protein